MVEYAKDELLSLTFKSLGDTTRRSLLTLLCQHGAYRVTDLATHYDMSLNAISKHIKVLERCQLVTRKTIGRTHWIEANLSQVKNLEHWLSDLKSIWSLRLERLDTLIKTEKSDV
jgi:DNA-binding transcriptional ArsR family regulator